MAFIMNLHLLVYINIMAPLRKKLSVVDFASLQQSIAFSYMRLQKHAMVKDFFLTI